MFGRDRLSGRHEDNHSMPHERLFEKWPRGSDGAQDNHKQWKGMGKQREGGDGKSDHRYTWTGHANKQMRPESNDDTIRSLSRWRPSTRSEEHRIAQSVQSVESSNGDNEEESKRRIATSAKSVESSSKDNQKEPTKGQGDKHKAHHRRPKTKVDIVKLSRPPGGSTDGEGEEGRPGDTTDEGATSADETSSNTGTETKRLRLSVVEPDAKEKIAATPAASDSSVKVESAKKKNPPVALSATNFKRSKIIGNKKEVCTSGNRCRPRLSYRWLFRLRRSQFSPSRWQLLCLRCFWLLAE